MLNKFTYQLELNTLDNCTTKTHLKAKISSYNNKGFKINAGCRIEIYLPYYTSPKHTEETQSRLLHFQLTQLAIAKWQELGFPIEDLPIYAQQLAQIPFNIILKE